MGTISVWLQVSVRWACLCPLFKVKKHFHVMIPLQCSVVQVVVCDGR